MNYQKNSIRDLLTAETEFRLVSFLISRFKNRWKNEIRFFKRCDYFLFIYLFIYALIIILEKKKMFSKWLFSPVNLCVLNKQLPNDNKYIKSLRRTSFLPPFLWIRRKLFYGVRQDLLTKLRSQFALLQFFFPFITLINFSSFFSASDPLFIFKTKNPNTSRSGQ